MKCFHPLLACSLLLIPFAVSQESDRTADTATDWPQFRGPGACGIREGAALPIEFETPTWRTEVKGLSHASPVTAGGRVFVATAIPKGGDAELKVGLYGAGDSADDLVETEFRLIAIDEAKGDVLWDVLAVKAVPPFGRHTKATQA
ncbi:MAG: hypothetical protein DRQ55_20620, partial [Planctomycetota bacterium]